MQVRLANELEGSVEGVGWVAIAMGCLGEVAREGGDDFLLGSEVDDGLGVRGVGTVGEGEGGGGVEDWGGGGGGFGEEGAGGEDAYYTC